MSAALPEIGPTSHGTLGAAGALGALCGPLGGFHPAVAEWFRRTYPDGPTEAQAVGWPAVAGGEDTLIAAPTGSGKTLAAFLVAIDRCYQAAAREEPSRGTEVVYVSPLRALTVDVAENLTRPLSGIAEVARELGYAAADIRVAVRNGDTSQSDRAAMLKNKPEIVVTTPESLYLLLTSLRGRELLGTVRTVIVDEIHALARDKRGSHLALSLARLDRVVELYRTSHPEIDLSPSRPVRIGLSATQRPISTIARLLVGVAPARLGPAEVHSPEVGYSPGYVQAASKERSCTVVDVGHRRSLDVGIELADDVLGPVSTHEQMAAVLGQIAEHIARRRTTLVFVNTRRMAERVAHRLGELVGEDLVQAHHGSLSMERRLKVERRLRAGELKAVVATASLELGIDVGPVELVCQIGSPRAISTWLQRAGRAQHHVGGTPVGRLYPLTRDELVECTALLGAVRLGELDAVLPPVAPLDILAQQIVAEVAASGPEGVSEAELFELVVSSAPFSTVEGSVFDEVVELVSAGVMTGRGRRGAHVHRDRVNAVLRPRRGARLVAVTSGGAIPEVADYRVVLEPEESFVGTVNEDWAIESMAGDVFLLGSQTWRIRRIESGTVRVVDAAGASPSVPFWLGEAPARTDELSGSVSALLSGVGEHLSASKAAALDWVKCFAGVGDDVAEQVVSYLATAAAELGLLPGTDRLVVERFFDDTGGMQLVLHAPLGSRINRALGLTLRKRFCRSFDFELQAAANDDAVVLSLGPQHSFPLSDVVDFLAPGGVREALVQAVLPTPMFGSRWRWNLGRSLVSPRFRGTRRLPPAIQRMEADDLMAAVFPSLAACQENVTGPIVVPDHPIVRQSLQDCCVEALDLDGLMSYLYRLRDGQIATRFVDALQPSVLAEEILNGKPYTFLDDAPLEERRTRAVRARGGAVLVPSDLGRLPLEVVTDVADQVRPDPRDAEELHDLLGSLVLVSPRAEWEAWFAQLVDDRRALEVCGGKPAAGAEPAGRHWLAVERRAGVEELFPQARFEPDIELPVRPGALAAPAAGAAPAGALSASEATLLDAVRGHLEASAPLTPTEIRERLGIGASRESEVLSALSRLEHEGSVLACKVGDDPLGRYSARHLLMRAHAAMRDRSRRSVQTFSAVQLMRFLVAWQHAGQGNRLTGRDGVATVVEQLQGVEAPVEIWESSILPARVAEYRPGYLDDLCSRGEIGFGRLAMDSAAPPSRRPSATPSPATPIALFRREDLSWLLAAIRGEAAIGGETAVRGEATMHAPSSGPSVDVLEALLSHGALFMSDLCSVTGRMPIEVAEALWDGIAHGLVTADSFQGVRGLLSARSRLASLVTPTPAPGRPAYRSSRRRALPRPGRPRSHVGPAMTGGRWSLLDARVEVSGEYDRDELAEALAGQLLSRWGIVFRELALREAIGIGWRNVLFALRRLEARGIVRGGRFIAGFVGEQFALPEAYEQLRAIANSKEQGEIVRLSAADPLNLTGIVLAGPRVPAVRSRRIEIVDGMLRQDTEAVGA